MRIALVILLVTNASTAHAESLVGWSTYEYSPDPFNGTPAQPRILMRRHVVGFPNETFASLNFEATPSDTPILWTIDETNAADYGGNWVDIEYWAARFWKAADREGADWTRNIRIGELSSIGHIQESWPLTTFAPGPGRHVVDFQFHRIEFEQTYWVEQTTFPFARGAKYEARLYAEGRIVAEPSTVAMGFVALALVRRRRLRF
jgi:hypothetical protein